MFVKFEENDILISNIYIYYTYSDSRNNFFCEYFCNDRLILPGAKRVHRSWRAPNKDLIRVHRVSRIRRSVSFSQKESPRERAEAEEEE